MTAAPAPSYSPTPRQAELLRFVAGFLEASGGASPTLHQIAEALGAASLTSIAQLLDGLEERGQLRRHHRRARAIELLHRPVLPRAPDGAPLFAVPLKGPCR